MQISQNSISGWLNEYDQETTTQIHQVVNSIINRKHQKRSVSLCQRKQDQCKSNLIEQQRNKSQILKPPRVPQNRMQELQKMMDFLQFNEQYKYDTYRFFNPNDPKFQPDMQNIIEQKKEQFKLKFKKQLQPLQDVNQISDRQQQQQKNNKIRIKTDYECQRTQSIHRIQSIKSIKDIMPKKNNNETTPFNKQIIQKGLDFLQLMIEKHKENVQHFIPKKNKNNIK